MKLFKKVDEWQNRYQLVKNIMRGESISPPSPCEPLSWISFPVVLDQSYGAIGFFIEKVNCFIHSNGKFIMDSEEPPFYSADSDIPIMIEPCAETILNERFHFSADYLGLKINPRITFGVKELDKDSSSLEIDDSSFNLAYLVYALLDPLEVPLKERIALTGVLQKENGGFSIGPVGDIAKKLYAVATYGIRRFFIPKENSDEIEQYLKNVHVEKMDGIFSLHIGTNHILDIIPVDTIEDVFAALFGKEWYKEKIFRKMFDLKYIFQQEALESNFVDIKNLLGKKDEKYAEMVSHYVKIKLLDYSEQARKEAIENIETDAPGSIYSKYREREFRKKEPPILPSQLIEKIEKDRNRVVIFGEAGAGKSTILRNILRQLCNEEFLKLKNMFPVFVEMGALNSYGSESDETNGDFVQQLIDYMIDTGKEKDTEEKHFVHKAVYKKYIKKLHEKKNVFFLLDAFDEMEDQSQFKAGDLDNVIVTSRYSGNIAGISNEYEIQPLEESKIKEFIENYIEDHNSRDELFDFIETSKDSTMKHMFSNPLFLSLVVYIQKKGDENRVLSDMTKTQLISTAMEKLVNRHPEDYQAIQDIMQTELWIDVRLEDFFIECIENVVENHFDEMSFKILFEWENIRSAIKQLIRNRKQGELKLSRRNYKQRIDEIANFLTTSTGILEHHRKAEYRFFHRIFLEFFVAKYVVDQISNNQEKFKNWINDHKFDLRYEMVFRFIAGLLDMQCSKSSFED